MPLFLERSTSYSPVLPDEWKALVGTEGESRLAFALKYANLAAQDKLLLPAENLCFRAFRELAPGAVKIVLLGQDPYPTPGHATGLSFSIPAGIPFARTLTNIFKELQADIGAVPPSGDLSHWAAQGVLLANAALTVPAGEAKAHAKIWEPFTRAWITALSRDGQRRIWLLWGGDAKKLGKHIDPSNNVVIETNHPSPLSANRGGWFGSRPFSRANEALVQAGYEAIRWA